LSIYANFGENNKVVIVNHFHRSDLRERVVQKHSAMTRCLFYFCDA